MVENIRGFSAMIFAAVGLVSLPIVRANDEFFVDDNFDVIIEVRHYASMLCAYWTPNVNGHQSVSNPTCD